MVKNLPASEGGGRDVGSIPGSRRSPGVIKTTHSSILAWKIPWAEEAGSHKELEMTQLLSTFTHTRDT